MMRNVFKSPGVKIPRFRCRGRGFDPWSGRFCMPLSKAKKREREREKQKPRRCWGPPAVSAPPPPDPGHGLSLPHVECQALLAASFTALA